MGSIVGLGLLLQRSERLRSQSETNFAIATQSLTDQVINNQIILFNDRYNIDKATRFGQVRNSLRTTLSHELELLRQNPRDCRGLQRLAFIYNDLAVFGSRDGDEAVSFNEKSVECWEAAVNLDPADSLDGYPTSERLLGQIILMKNLIDLRRDDLYDRWNSRARAVLQLVKSSPDAHAGRRHLLSGWHRVRADYLMSHNEPDRARRELQDDLDFLRSAPAAELEYPTFALCEALTRAKLGRWSGESSLPRPPIRSAPVTVSIECVILDLDELATERIGWLLLSDGLSPSNRQDLPAGARTDRVLSAIRSDAAMFGLENNRLPKICWSMRPVYSANLGELRRIQHPDDANRLADCLLKLAEHLTRAYPEQADSFMLLSDAYIQKAKNAYQEDAMVDAGSFEHLALDAAIKASRVEPGNGGARNLVEDRRARVSRLASN